MIEQQIPQSLTIGAETPNIDFTFKGNKGHPERVIQGLFRVDRYLNLPSEIPSGAQRSVRELIELYQPQIEKKGKDSVAQLCPPKCHFEALTTKGIDLVYHRDNVKATVFINTIDQLRGLFEILDETPSIRVFVHRQNERELSNRLDLAVMRNLLSAWDVIPDGSMQQAPR